MLPTELLLMAYWINGHTHFAPSPTMPACYYHFSSPSETPSSLLSQEDLRLVILKETSLLYPPAYIGGLGLTNPVEVSHREFKSSEKIPALLVTLIMLQWHEITYEAICHQQLAKTNVQTSRRLHLYIHHCSQIKRKNVPLFETCHKTCLWERCLLPITATGFTLHKGPLRDALCLRYNW